MTDLELASDPSTPAYALEGLAKHREEAVRRAVSSNPNASKVTLSRLFYSFSKEVLANPAAVLYEIEEPGLQWIDATVRDWVANSKTTPTTTLERLSWDDNVNVRCRVASNTSTPEDTIDRLSMDSDVIVRRSAARNTSALEDTLKRLAHESDAAVRWSVANNKSTPITTIKELLDDKDEDVKKKAKDRLGQ